MLGWEKFGEVQPQIGSLPNPGRGPIPPSTAEREEGESKRSDRQAAIGFAGPIPNASRGLIESFLCVPSARGPFLVVGLIANFISCLRYRGGFRAHHPRAFVSDVPTSPLFPTPFAVWRAPGNTCLITAIARPVAVNL